MQCRCFVKACGIGSAALASGCGSSTGFYKAANLGDKLALDKMLFERADQIMVDYGEFPVGVFHLGNDEYTANLMLCPHQACMTVVKGDGYVCPCHGSRFSNQGELIKGPAKQDLKHFATSADKSFVYIHLD